MHFFNFFHATAQGIKFDLSVKKGQGKPRVIVYINFEGLTPKMLHIKFEGNRPGGSGKEDFSTFLPYTSLAAILVM